MNKMKLSISLFCLIALAIIGCHGPTEPGVTPPQPHFTQNSVPPDTADRGIFADPATNEIVLEWRADSTKQTTGYVVYRSNDDTLNSDGTLKNGFVVTTIQPSNQLFEALDTMWADTAVPLLRLEQYYYYQVRAYNTSGTNVRTYSTPSAVGYFKLLQKPLPNGPIGPGNNPSSLSFNWRDNDNAGQYQLFLRMASATMVWSSFRIQELGDPISNPLPSDISLLPNVQYQWRVKSFGGDGHSGSSSPWVNFTVQ